MKSTLLTLMLLSLLTIAKTQDLGNDCTNIIITKGATTTQSVHICYTCDAPFISRLKNIPATNYSDTTYISPKDIRGNVRVKQVAHTYAILGSNGIGHMNEHQLAIGETTFEGRKGLFNKKGLHYSDLMTLALQRTKTAREAVKLMGKLANKYGYRSPGESFSIGDKNEAWIMEMIGKGDIKGAVWVAIRIPDGYVSCHANQSRIREFDMNDTNNCLYAKDVITFAIKKGFYKKQNGKFNFSDAYDPADLRKKRTCAMRVWSILSRVAPSLKLSSDYHRGVKNADRYPLYVKPDNKLTLNNVFKLFRDLYENTEFDMTNGDSVGTFNPFQASHERALSTPITAFSIISQSRASLPDQIGGVLWYSPDNSYFSCRVPIYCSVSAVPKAYSYGEYDKFSWNSAWWTMNFVSNYVYLNYKKMSIDIQKVQSTIENSFIKQQYAIEKTGQELLKKDKKQAKIFLTNYSINSGEQVMREWKKLGEHLITKYIR